MQDWQKDALKAIERAMANLGEVRAKDLIEMGYQVSFLAQAIRAGFKDNVEYRIQEIENLLAANGIRQEESE